MMPQVRAFTVAEVAMRTGLPMPTIRGAIRCGELGALQANARTIRIPEPDLVRWLDLLRGRAQRMQLR
jgi:excisionase family DNA binding protein